MKSLLVTFPNVYCQPREITDFRGEINRLLDNADDFFHNHDDNAKGGLLYRYPLIQFRSVDGKAAIYAIDQAADRLLQILGSGFLPDRYSENYQVQNNKLEISMTAAPKVYRLNHFLPFDGRNYKKYKDLESLSERAALIEQVTANHILNFCKEVGFDVPNKSLKVILKNLESQKEQSIKTAKTLCFNITFLANINLPDYLGLGRVKAQGYGVLKEVYTKTSKPTSLSEAEKLGH
jgi:hypothetical protein